MMAFEADDVAGVVEFRVEGAITREEYDRGVAAMEAIIARHGKVRALAVVRDFAGMELAAWWKDISWGVSHWGKVSRAAIVTDTGWIEMATKAGRLVIPAEVKLFSLAEIDAARAWVRA